ncbi:MAG: class I SAM-dependent methyltransferase [Bacteroidales bacterium]
MQYEPLKNTLGKLVGRKPRIRIWLYRLLDIHLLRTWHVKKYLKSWHKNRLNGTVILDAGSGFGQYTYFLARLSDTSRVEAVDINGEQVNNCRRFIDHTPLKQRVSFRKADLTEFMEPEKYDLILSVDVMEHIADDEIVFSNFYRSLRPGGMLLVTTPSDRGGSDVNEEGEHSFIEEHVRDGYSVEEITGKLTRAGFGRVETGYTYGIPGNISWKLGMKYPLTLIGRHRFFLLLIPFYYLLTYPFILILNILDVHINHSHGTGLIVRAWK